jgi:hypothetical protein
MSLERASPRVNVAPVRRNSAILLSPVLFASSAMAGDFPDEWLGDIKLRLETQYALPGASDSIVVEGVLALSVIASTVTGRADLTANHQWMIPGCSARGQYPFQVAYTGNLGSRSGAEGGKTIEVASQTDEFTYTETIHCRTGTRTVERQWTAPTWPSPMLIVDGQEASFQSAAGSGVRFHNTARLITPCAGWDTRRDSGPRVKFVEIDPRTEPQPEIAPSYENTVDQLTERANMSREEGDVARRRALRVKDVGLTFGPSAEDFTIADPAVSTTEPRKTEYAECVSVALVEVHIPIEKIHTWIGSDVGTTGSCADFAHGDEKWHYDQLWAMLQTIANAIELKLQTEIPGPANALPRTTTGGADEIKSRIRSAIDHTVRPLLRTLKLEGEAHDKRPDEQRRRREACPGFAPRVVE